MNHDDTSLFRTGENCCSIAKAPRVALLVDAQAYFDAFRQAAERAERSIVILAWDFNSSAPLTPDGISVGDYLNGLARRKRHLEVRILDWDFPLLFQNDRELPPIFGLGWKPHHRVHFRFDATHATAGSQHQKIAVIDDSLAFVGGLDMTARRWDTPEHRPDDPRRRANGVPYPPFHDVMAALDGEAAAALAKVAHNRWHKATGERMTARPLRNDVWPESMDVDLRDVTTAVACTAPADDDGRGVREVERLYLDMIARARKYIYIENQYFTSQAIGEALAARLREPAGPEIVVVTRKLSHGWLEEVTMHALRTRLVRELRAADTRGRLHVYYPHIAGLAEGTCIDIHSKVMIVDDEWLRVGSSNVSNRSMGLDSECDVVVEAAGRPDVAAAIRRFRDRLLAEHAGRPVDQLAAAMTRAGSLHGGIDALRTEERALCVLEDQDQPEYSEATLAALSVADPEKPVSLETLVEQIAPGVEVERAVLTWRKGLAVAAIALGIAALWRFTPLAELASAEAAAEWAERLGAHWWAAPLVVLAYTPASLVMFPRALLTVGAVLAFGPWIGLACAISGNLLAAAVTYFAGRAFSRDTVRALAGTRLNPLSHAFKKRGLLAITALRLVPAAPFAIENVVAGAIHIPARDYLLGTFFGMLPGELASTVFGRQLQAALLESSPVNYGLVAAVVAALAAGAFVVHRVLRRMVTASGARPRCTDDEVATPPHTACV